MFLKVNGMHQYELERKIRRGGILCYWPNGKITLFSPSEYFDRSIHKWSVTYREIPINKHDIPPRPTGVYSNEEFYDLLYEISDFANSHDFSSFVEYYFGKSISYLEGKNLDDSEFSSLKLGEPYRKIYMATEKADIFGGMGTWLDSPRATAHIDGFEPEFNEITGKVIAEIDNSVDYLVHSDFREEKRQLLPCKKTDVENESIIDSSGSLGEDENRYYMKQPPMPVDLSIEELKEIYIYYRGCIGGVSRVYGQDVFEALKAIDEETKYIWMVEKMNSLRDRIRANGYDFSNEVLEFFGFVKLRLNDETFDMLMEVASNLRIHTDRDRCLLMYNLVDSYHRKNTILFESFIMCKEGKSRELFSIICKVLHEITEDYMQEYVKFYQAELKSIETYLYLGDTENYPQYCYKPKANKYLQRNFELSKISGETEKEIDRLLAINDDEIVRVVNEMLPEFDKIRDIIDVNQNPKQYGISDLRKNLSPLKDKERCSKLIKLMDKMYLEIEKIPMEPTDV